MKTSQPSLALKVDVDTDTGTRLGVPRLVEILKSRNLPATFFFSLGPDNTGKAIRRVFRPGFLRKVTRTKVARRYGWRTLLSGTLLPARHIGRNNQEIIQSVGDAGFEVGIHCHDHFRWQDYLNHWDYKQTHTEFSKAVGEFTRIFGRFPSSAAAPGWQTNINSFAVYEALSLKYVSDTRGRTPYYPSIGGRQFKTLEIPTTLPTLDELLGLPGFEVAALPDHYNRLLVRDAPNVWTIHAELEGQSLSDVFERILDRILDNGYSCTTLEAIASSTKTSGDLTHCEIESASVYGRTGLVACQRCENTPQTSSVPGY